MNISIIGTGYVGLVTGACLAEIGMNVICMDIDQDKINRLKNGEVPIFEDKLEELITNNYLFNKRINFTTSIKEAVQHGDVIFIAVPTPQDADGNADLQFVFEAAREIGKYIDQYKVVVNKCTVPIGTGKRVKEEIEKVLKDRNIFIDFDVVSNPEFLREGNAVKDFINPSRIVIGAEGQKAVEIMKNVYKIQSLLDIPIIVTNIETAEMVKYAANTFLASKISFINEVANMCELCGADVSIVSKAMGLDNRIGSKFLEPGPGYGGSCFPKDTRAFIGIGKTLGYIPQIVKSAVDVNNNQKKRMVKKIRKTVGSLKDKTITILGIAFKPNTDDIRESPAIEIIKELVGNNAKVKVFDPKAMDNMKKYYPEIDIEYCVDAISACVDSDCIVVVTDWEEFKNLDFQKINTVVHTPKMLDLRNVYDSEYIKSLGFSYEGVGRK